MTQLELWSEMGGGKQSLAAVLRYMRSNDCAKRERQGDYVDDGGEEDGEEVPGIVSDAIANHDAESLFCSKPISEISSVEFDTKRQIDSKKEEIRLLVGASYRDLINSADSIISIREYSCSSISSNLSTVDSVIQTLNPQ